jgi:nucleoid-associated protein YgaU
MTVSCTNLGKFEDKVKTTSIVAIALAAVAVLALAVTYWPESTEPQIEARAVAQLGEQAAPQVPQKPQLVELVRPSFDVVRISREGTGVIAGRSAPDAFVEVIVGEEIIGRVRANQGGEWVLIFDAPLDVGPQELSLVAHSKGREAVQSDDIVILSLPEREGEAATGSENGVIAVLTPRYGGGVSKVLQKPGSYMGDTVLEVSTLDFDERGKAIFSGVADASATIRIYLDNEFIGTATADTTGQWTYSPDNMVFAGAHVLRLDQVLEGDGVEIRVEQPFDTITALDLDLAESHVIIKSGNNLWHIARRVYGSGVLYTQIFRANNERIRNPDLIYPGQKFLLPRAEAFSPADF